ncbi:3-oxoadipyl-CoA thiolase [Aestuariispira insulae]|uniref:Beta-ketoadipyl-CoA thiolase n=1 Tax=Aestuariispira insulae TaxID=1461337 RepID=A0A3D9HWS3_9PROT|nr:3-oxoadipyl-CoA thiolase [Aestuariispira insulae]RED53356.1 3-oxo-5,6-didehydrosuberyl-CoA/3-oxoadipyl-CoA thiolase [Aestuariispira insulae]
MSDAFIIDAIRTPIGRYGGTLSAVRTDDLAAQPIRALMERSPRLDWEGVDDVILGCANQAGEDNRNLARMASLLAGLPVTVPGTTVNRLCGSGMDAVALAARSLKCGEAGLMIAGGAESMSRAPLVMPKADSAFSRDARIFDSTIGWRFINPVMEKAYGTDSMPETAENVAETYGISREDQDLFAFNSQQKTGAAQNAGIFEAEIVPVSIPQRKGDPIQMTTDEHPRPGTSLEKLKALKAPFRENGTVTAGTSSGVNDGACSILLANGKAAQVNGLTPRARVLACATAGVEPRLMGMGPVPASQKALGLAGLSLDQMDVIELNEAFAAQALAVIRQMGLPDDDPRINPNGGAIALGHPLGMSGARLITTAVNQLERSNGRYALCTMCIGVGQGIAMIIERL